MPSGLRDAVVIGAGVLGASTALRLAEAIVFDRAD